jgi:hypothetical protein
MHPQCCPWNFLEVVTEEELHPTWRNKGQSPCSMNLLGFFFLLEFGEFGEFGSSLKNAL